MFISYGFGQVFDIKPQVYSQNSKVIRLGHMMRSFGLIIEHRRQAIQYQTVHFQQ